MIVREFLRKRADIFRAEANDDARVVEVVGLDADQPDVAADVARGGDDELQQTARRRLRFRLMVL